MNARPVWAGVVVKLADGTTWAFELTDEAAHRLSADIQVERDVEETTRFGDVFRSCAPLPTSRVQIKLDGTGGRSTRFAGMADDVPVRVVEDAPRELAGGAHG